METIISTANIASNENVLMSGASTGSQNQHQQSMLITDSIESGRSMENIYNHSKYFKHNNDVFP